MKKKLFWRLLYYGAVCKGDWKLIRFDNAPHRLYNLKEDIAEQNDLSKKFPDKAQELLNDYEQWEKELKNPL